jgi:hypothetical protein
VPSIRRRRDCPQDGTEAKIVSGTGRRAILTRLDVI